MTMPIGPERSSRLEAVREVFLGMAARVLKSEMPGVPMNFSTFGVIVFSLLLPGLPLLASPLEEKVEAFKSAVREQIAAHPEKEPGKPVAAAYVDTGALMASLDQIPFQMESPNSVRNVEVELSDLLSSYPTAEVQKTGHILLDEIHQQRQAHLDAAATEVRALIKSASDAITQAKKAEDLDAIVAQLQKFLGDKYGFNSENQALYQQAESACAFSKLWQDYLAHLNRGQTQLAAGDLQSALAADQGSGLIPRSHMLALLADTTRANAGPSAAASSETEKILNGIKTLADMEPALHQLARLAQNDPQASLASAQLAPLVQLYTSVKAGLPETLNFNSLGGNMPSVLSPQLQSQLLLLVFRHYFDSSKIAAPMPDEKPDRYVNRVMAEALAGQDWPLLKKTVAARIFFDRSSALAMAGPNPTVGIDDLLAGINQQAAAQYALAVVSYQNALKVSDTAIPAPFIGSRLAEIRKDHPAEYEQGMRMALSPPVARFMPASVPGNAPSPRPSSTGNSTPLIPHSSIPTPPSISSPTPSGK